MKQVEITLRLACRDDVPRPELEWMAITMGGHALDAFGRAYVPESGEAPLLVGTGVPGYVVAGKEAFTFEVFTGVGSGSRASARRRRPRSLVASPTAG